MKTSRKSGKSKNLEKKENPENPENRITWKIRKIEKYVGNPEWKSGKSKNLENLENPEETSLAKSLEKKEINRKKENKTKNITYKQIKSVAYTVLHIFSFNVWCLIPNVYTGLVPR